MIIHKNNKKELVGILRKVFPSFYYQGKKLHLAYGLTNKKQNIKIMVYDTESLLNTKKEVIEFLPFNLRNEYGIQNLCFPVVRKLQYFGVDVCVIQIEFDKYKFTHLFQCTISKINCLKK